MKDPRRARRWHEAAIRWVTMCAASTIAVVGARPYAGGWNDGSRLATVEVLVDQHTLAIDHSVFVVVPRDGSCPAPYDPREAALESGTGDKLFIRGHYYSDKSPVPAVLMAGAYGMFQWLTGIRAAERPDLFTFWMTLLSSGVSYVLAVWCVLRFAEKLGVSAGRRALLVTSFALATVALPYSRHANNHILLLAVAAGILLELARLATDVNGEAACRNRLVALGSLAGLGYTIDLGAGPILLMCLMGVVAWRCQNWRSAAVVLAAALPWLVLHHALNYAVGGTLKPANAVPEYFRWPGCAFTPQNMTGAWNHSLTHCVVYGAALLFGKRGFFGHNLPLMLLLPALGLLLRGARRDRPEIAFAGLWCGGTWLVYTLSSTNYSGQCCSIRWFVPLLAPAYYGLALLLRDQRQLMAAFAGLSAWGMVMGALMWREGPWMKHMVPLYWPLQTAALVTAGALLWRSHRGRRPAHLKATPLRPASAA